MNRWPPAILALALTAGSLGPVTRAHRHPGAQDAYPGRALWPAQDAAARTATPGVATMPQGRPSGRQRRPERAVRRPQVPRRFDRRGSVLRFALRQLGKRYVWGAAGPDAWDCSGLVMAAYGRQGVRLPHQTEAMLTARRVRQVPVAQLRPGDLVWPQPGHVALYLGQGRIVHAANPGQGVRIDPLYSFLAAGRVDL